MGVGKGGGDGGGEGEGAVGLVTEPVDEEKAGLEGSEWLSKRRGAGRLEAASRLARGRQRARLSVELLADRAGDGDRLVFGVGPGGVIRSAAKEALPGCGRVVRGLAAARSALSARGDVAGVEAPPRGVPQLVLQVVVHAQLCARQELVEESRHELRHEIVERLVVSPQHLRVVH